MDGSTLPPNSNMLQKRSSPSALLPNCLRLGMASNGKSGGEMQFGEIVETNDGQNMAVVQPIPGTEVIEIKQDELRA
ncbi:MAG: hypothetical protein R3C56_36935 [Pirellulaceae bacterium]